MRNYGRALFHFREVFPLVEPRLYQTHSLGSFWSLLLPWPRAAFGLSVASAIGVLALTVLCWRAQASLAIRYSALLFATVLVAPHLTVYDLVILAPAFLLLGDWAAGQDLGKVRSRIRQRRCGCFFTPVIHCSYWDR